VAVEQATKLMSDKQFKQLKPQLMGLNDTGSEDMQETILRDILTRAENVRMPALVDLLRRPPYQGQQEIREILEAYVDVDYGTDIPKWDAAVHKWLIDNDAQTWMGWVITLGELAVGLGLLFGVLTGFAAFFGALMNMSFLLAGSASTNPIMFTLAVGIMLAWKVAGYYGLDRWLLPLLGVPWKAKLEVAPPTPTTPRDAPTG